MPEPSISRRQRNAKDKAKQELLEDGYVIVPCDNSIICLLASRESHEKKLRIVVDEITKNDINLVKNKVKLFSQQSREIWCDIKGFRKFKKIEIKKDGTIEVLFDPIDT